MNVNIKKIIQPMISFFAGIAVISVFIFFTSDDFLQSLKYFFLKPFISFWYFSLMIDKTVLLLFSAAGAAFAFKTGNFNLGGEGQIYFAGFLTAVLLKNENALPPFIYFFIVMFIVAVSTGIMGFISGILKTSFAVDELLSSFLISSAIIPAINYLITSPMRDTSGNLLATAPVSKVFLLSKFFPPVNFNAAFFAAIILILVTALFFDKTKSGYRLIISGTAKEFAEFAGFSKKAPPIIGMTVSAVLHSFSGFFAITGSYGLCHLNFSAGMGWSALVASLIAGRNVLALIPAVFLYAWIQTASDAAVMSGNIKFNVSIFLQAAVFLFISANLIFLKPKPILSAFKNKFVTRFISD